MLSNQSSPRILPVNRGLSRQALRAIGNQPAWEVLSELANRYLDAVEQYWDKLRELAQAYDLAHREVDVLGTLNLEPPQDLSKEENRQRVVRRMNSFVEANPQLDLRDPRKLHPLVVAEALFRWLNPEFAEKDWDPSKGPSV